MIAGETQAIVNDYDNFFLFKKRSKQQKADRRAKRKANRKRTWNEVKGFVATQGVGGIFDILGVGKNDPQQGGQPTFGGPPPPVYGQSPPPVETGDTPGKTPTSYLVIGGIVIIAGILLFLDNRKR